MNVAGSRRKRPMTHRNPSLARQHIAWCVTFVHAIDREALTELTGLEGQELETWILREIVRFCMRDQEREYYVTERGRDGRRRHRTTL